jgi:hypothetical protein
MKDSAFLTTGIIGFFVAYLVWWARNDTRPLTFWSKATTLTFLQTDPDNYMRRLSKADLVARKAGSHDEYRYWSALSAPANFSEIEKYKLKQATKKADAFFGSLATHANMPYFHLHNKALPWVFARVTGVYYEGGYPHTRKDAIFITDGVMNRSLKEIIELVIHEKIHIIQRQFPKETHLLLKEIGFRRVGKKSDFLCARANPDIDDNVYAHPQMRDGAPWVACYKSEAPSGIHDVMNGDKFEHPFEFIAYTVSNMSLQ